MTDSPAQPHSPRAGEAPQPPAAQAAPSLPSLSMELFPPRPGRSSSQTWAALDRLLGTCPDFVSVTYRPTFVTDDDGTVRVVRQRNAAEDVIAHVLSTSQFPLMAHLTLGDYPATFIVPPPKFADCIEHGEYYGELRDGSGFWIDCPLWTKEEGRSDLEVQLFARTAGDGAWDLDVTNILVP